MNKRCIGSEIITSLDIYRCNARGSKYTLEVSHISECLLNNASCKRLLYVSFLIARPIPAVVIQFQDFMTSARRGLNEFLAFGISLQWENISLGTIQETDCKFITYLAKQQINQGKSLKKLIFPFKHVYFCSNSFNYSYFCKQLQYNPKKQL